MTDEDTKYKNIVKAGAPVLLAPTKKVPRSRLPSDNIDQLVAQLAEALSQSHGVGISANQVGRSERVCWIEVNESHMQSIGAAAAKKRGQTLVQGYALVNPHIVERSDEEAAWFEGCLSLPGLTGIVRRPVSVIVEALDLRGKSVRLKAAGWHARILCHELDHLDGHLYTERVVRRSLMRRDTYDEHWKGKPMKSVLRSIESSLDTATL